MVLSLAGVALMLLSPAAAQQFNAAQHAQGQSCVSCHATPANQKPAPFGSTAPDDTAALYAWVNANPTAQPAQTNPFLLNRCSTINCHQPPANSTMGLHEPAFNWDPSPCRSNNCHTPNGPSNPFSSSLMSTADVDALKAWIAADMPVKKDDPQDKKDPAVVPVKKEDPQTDPKVEKQPVVVAPVKPAATQTAKDQLDQADAGKGTGDTFDGAAPPDTQADQKTPSGDGGDGKPKPSPAGQKYPKPKTPAVDSQSPVPSPVGMGLAEARGSSVKSDSESAYDVKSAVFMGVSAGVGGAVAGAVLGGPLGAGIGGLLGAGLGALFGFL